MKAVLLTGERQMAFTERQNPPLLPDEVRINVKACGICGTDQHIYHGKPGSAQVAPPIVLGHELAGEVAEVGLNVGSLKPGDRVSIDPNIYCGGCEFCRSGRPHLCDRLQAIGVTRDGGMAQSCVAPAHNCYRIPDEMSYVEGALIEPLGCVMHGFKKLDVQPKQTVLIIGGGFIGQLFLQLFKRQSVSRICVCEPVAEKHAMLRRLGADEAFHPRDGQAAALAEACDIVVECVGRKESMEMAVQCARKGGQVLLFGVASPEVQIAVSPYHVFSKELRLTGSFINPYTHEEAIELIRQGAVNVEPLVSHRFSLEDVPEVMGKYPEMTVSKGVILI